MSARRLVAWRAAVLAFLSFRGATHRAVFNAGLLCGAVVVWVSQFLADLLFPLSG